MGEERNYWRQWMRRRCSRRILLQTGAAAGVGWAVGGSILGCNSQSQTQPKAGTTATSAEQPQSGGVLTLPLLNDPPTLDFLTASDYTMIHAMQGVYSNLVQYDPMDPNKVIPDLAEKWTVSPDGKVYTFSLHKGVKWHDGSPCTSADVKATLDLVRNPPKGYVSPRKDQLGAIDGIETPDETTVRINLKRPMSSLLGTIAIGFMPIVQKRVIDSGPENLNKPQNAIGTGPFKLKEYVRGVSIEIVKNPDYFIKGRPYLDGVKSFVIPDGATTFANFKSGQILFWPYGMTGEQGRQAEKDFGDKVLIQNGASLTMEAIIFSPKKPWDDVRMRQAISLLIDRQEVIKVALQGDADIGGAMNPGTPWALPASELEKLPGYGKNYQANVAEAKKLMAEAGYPNGLSVTLLARKASAATPFTTVFQNQLTKAGIDAKIDTKELAATMADLNGRTFDICPYRFGFAMDDPDLVFGESFLCGAARNYGDLCIKEIDDLYQKQAQALDLNERKKLVNQMDILVVKNAMRAIADLPQHSTGQSRRVRDWLISPSNFNNYRYQDVWLTKA